MARISRQRRDGRRFMYYVYIVKSLSTGKKYIGHSQNLEERLARHNSGREQSTKTGKPWVLVYNEVFDTRALAMKRERQLKSYKGGEALNKLIQIGE
jgi:putative endonuclease